MKILHIAVFLFTIHMLGVWGQQQASPDVQKKLIQLSGAIETLRGSSTPPPPPTTTQPSPPVVQQPCDCSPTVNWTSVPMTSIGSSNLREPGTLVYNIPSVIPSNAKEVLVLVSIDVGTSGPNLLHYVKIYTQQKQRQYEKYIALHTYTQDAVNTNSDNLWFPMTFARQLFVESTAAHTGYVGIYLFAIGYR